jgi:DNA-directed RNA polymerase specialized sigma24 family protein
MDTAQLSDAALLLQIKEDYRSSFNILFDRYWGKLYQAALVRVNDDAIAQDIVQELFIKVWHTLAIHLSLENYLLGTVRLSVLSYFRSRKVNTVRLEDALQRIEYLEESMNANAD